MKTERDRKRGRPDCRGLNQCSSLVSFFPSPLFFHFSLSLSLSNDSQWKEKAFSLSSVELHISFLLERQGGNTQSNTRVRTYTHTNTHRRRPSRVDSSLPEKLGQALKCPVLRCTETSNVKCLVGTAKAQQSNKHTCKQTPVALGIYTH